MKNTMQIFNNPEFGELRTVEKGGKIFFVASDVAKMLGYKNISDAVSRHCRYIAKRDIPHPQGKGTLTVNIIPEGDVYRLIVNSKLPAAEKFESWVFDEVLPDIRKYGMYAKQDVIDMMIGDPDSCIALLTKYKEEKQAKEQLRIELDKSKEWYTIKRVAQLNGVSWKDFSWRKLKQTSAELGYDVKKIFDANYGNVNVYHVKVWKCVYPNLEL